MSVKKKAIEEFEKTILEAEAKALSSVSLERPLSDAEYARYVGLAEKLGLRPKKDEPSD
ncbi:hypothetical protein J4441_03150 [Candidatus Micrarchaeota archaeon]|nr:hypothetical protein [Candidatus Micrarchaeota archaeon]